MLGEFRAEAACRRVCKQGIDADQECRNGSKTGNGIEDVAEMGPGYHDHVADPFGGEYGIGTCWSPDVERDGVVRCLILLHLCLAGPEDVR